MTREWPSIRYLTWQPNTDLTEKYSPRTNVLAYFTATSVTYRDSFNNVSASTAASDKELIDDDDDEELDKKSKQGPIL